MLARLGNVLYWACCGLAAIPWLFAAIWILSEGYLRDIHRWPIVLAVAAVISIVVWLGGRAARYVLAGT